MRHFSLFGILVILVAVLVACGTGDAAQSPGETEASGAVHSSLATSEPPEATAEPAVAQISGMALETAHLYRGLKNSIEILKANRDPKQYRTGRWTPHEGVPKSVEKGKSQPAGV